MRTRPIRDFIISNVQDNPKGITRLAAERFGISTKAVNYHERKLSAVFDAFSTPESDFAFDRTNVPVRLARFGEEALVSRSQAKRLLAGIDRFKEVWLDFQGVSSIGQAFADEIFRVYTRSHSDITILPVNANEEILRMIHRTKSGTDLSEVRERLLSDLSE